MTDPRRVYFLQPDGCADEPIAELDGKTPLAAARTPNLDRLAQQGRCISLETIPKGFPPGSDIGNMSLLGFDPNQFFTGRAPIEAAAMGEVLADDEVAFRCNLVNIDHGQDSPVMVDFSAGHIETDEAHQLIAALAERLPGVRLLPGVSYRHILVAQPGSGSAETTPPHDIQGQSVDAYLPVGDWSRQCLEWMGMAREVLAEHPVNQARIDRGDLPATDIWLWGQGGATQLESLETRHGRTGAMITAVDLLRGLAVLTGMRNIAVPGATGFIDTNYAGKAQAAIDAPEPFVFLHLEAPDESSHMGSLPYKIESLERFDAEIVGPILADAEQAGALIVVTPDHPTLIRTRTHALANVPCVVWDSQNLVDSGVAGYDESIVETGEPVQAWRLLDSVWD